MSAPARSRPRIAVVARVPLFVEALAGVFDGLGDLQAVRGADAELGGLLAALHPDAVIVEATDEPDLDLGVPLVHVDLERRTVQSRLAGEWTLHGIELSGEAIRNVVLEAMFVGAEPRS
jgi:hypothetical protein